MHRGDLASALSLADAGILGSRKDVDWNWRFRILKAEVLVWQGKSRDALALVEQEPPSSLSQDEALVRRRISQGYANCFLQDFQQCRLSFERAAELSSQHPDLSGEVIAGEGTLAVLQRDYVRADELFKEALTDARSRRNVFVEANALGNLGYSAMRRERYGEAIDWFNDSLRLSQQIGNRAQTAKNLGNLGWCYYELGDFERALESFKQSESLSEQLGILKDQLLWQNNIGLISYQRRDFESADLNYKSALETARRLENKSSVVMALNNLATTALERGQLDVAEKFTKEALEIERTITSDASSLDTYFLDALMNESRILREQGHFNEAIELLSRVIRGAGENLSQKWEAQSELAGAYAQQGQRVRADELYRKSLQTIDAARATLSQEEYRLSFLSVATRFYNDYIDFLVAHGREREALAVAEHSRARTLAEGLKVPVSQLSGAAFRPEQSARKLNSVVLSYWLKPGKSYLWVVTPTKVALFPLAGQDEIDGAVQEYRKALLGPRSESATAPGQKLYEMLLAPAQKLLPKPCGAPGGCAEAPRVVVIGDGSLLSLNFETLQVPEPQPHYWIEDVTVNNASSVALLGASENRTSAKGDREKLLAMGDPVYAGTEFPQLTQAKLELQRVSEHFPQSERVVIEGKSAVPASYGSTKPGQFGYIHFVAHGTASRISPLDSSIVLSRDGDAYKLYARDIMAQPLKADLVTISACYGAGNRAYTGEGLIGLSWAFMRAGAHHVIAALWEVNDLSTPQLMGTLYDNLKKGKDPADALRAAKLGLLHSDGVFRRPFYWGAFMLYSGS